MNEEEIQFEIVFNEMNGQANIQPLNSYTKELFSYLIEEEIQELLKPYFNYAMTGYIKYAMKQRLTRYLINGIF